MSYQGLPSPARKVWQRVAFHFGLFGWRSFFCTKQAKQAGRQTLSKAFCKQKSGGKDRKLFHFSPHRTHFWSPFYSGNWGTSATTWQSPRGTHEKEQTNNEFWVKLWSLQFCLSDILSRLKFSPPAQVAFVRPLKSWRLPAKSTLSRVTRQAVVVSSRISVFV